MILEQIQTPADVKRLNNDEVRRLCQELRGFLISRVSQTGGHLASNLGVVELTVAIHRVFDTSRDRLVFDVGHQCYVHKALTGGRRSSRRCASSAGFRAFRSPMRASTTRLSPGTRPIPCPSRSVWRGHARCAMRTTASWRSSATAR